MIQEVFKHLVTQTEAKVGVGCVKGFPTWARPSAGPPCAALELTDWGASGLTRIGQKQARQVLGLRLWVFARNEPELAQMLDSLADWMRAGEAPAIEGYRLDVAWGNGLRHTNESGSQQEAYAFWLPLTVTWS